MKGPAVAQALAVTPENQLTNTACSCQSFVMNAEPSTLYPKLSTAVSVELNEFNIQIVQYFL